MIFKSSGTILGSSLKIKDTVLKIKEFGYKAALLCDTEFFSALDFFYACTKDEDTAILPILSIEKVVEGVTYIFVAKNGIGFHEISEMNATKNYVKSDNIFVVLKDFEDIMYLDIALDFIDYVAIDNLPKNTGQKMHELVLLEYAKTNNLGLMPFQAADHMEREDYRVTNALKAIGQKTQLDTIAISGGSIPENYLLPKEEFLSSYSKEAMDNFFSMVKACSIEGYNFGDPIPPHFQFREELAVLEGLSPDISEPELFAHMSRVGLDKRLLKINKSDHAMYKKRLEFEINVINEMKFPGYMLIVQDFVIAAKERNIPVGPGRGSAAGSLVAYSLEITDIDPMPYGLLFERFLNPERISMPDIDMDFAQDRRQEIIDYVIERYGKEKVAQIATFTGLKAKGSIKDAARILSYDLKKTEALAKLIPEGATLSEALELEPEAINAAISSPDAARVWKYALKLEGLTRGLGVHAAGLVITDVPVYLKCPLADVNGTQVVQFDGNYLEDVDLIKFDFLGLKTLTIIQETIDRVYRNHGIKIDFSNMPYEDKATYDMIATGHTSGVFQIESDGMQQLCKRLKPDCFEDITAVLALFRPGPMESGMLEDFVLRKTGVKKVKYFFDDFEEVLKPILKATYGVIVYQEQVMQIVQEVGGFSLGEADVIRRAMGKKDITYMEQMAEKFADGAEKKGLNRTNAVELFNKIREFAGYGFNKSHSAGYAVITFYTGYLKANFPGEFLASVLNMGMKEDEKLSKYISEVKRLKIEVSPIDINTSTEEFDFSGNTLSFALSAIKGVGAGSAVCISAREQELFSSFSDFVVRCRIAGHKVNKRVFEGLANSGALDQFGLTRKAMFENSEAILKAGDKQDPNAQIFQDLPLIKDEYTSAEIILLGKKLVGMYLIDPFEKAKSILDPYVIPHIAELPKGKHHLVIYPETITYKTSAKKKKYATMVGYFREETINILAFNNAFEELKVANPHRPMIVEININDEGTAFLNSVIEFKKSTLELFFSLNPNFNAVEDSTPVVVPDTVVEEIAPVVTSNDCVEIKTGDYEGLVGNMFSGQDLKVIGGTVEYTLVR